MKKSILFLLTLLAAPAHADETRSPEITEVNGHLDIRANGWHAMVTEDQIAWCVNVGDLSECGVSETRFGCQYFSEDGPDDIATCVLTVVNEACGGCIAQ